VLTGSCPAAAICWRMEDMITFCPDCYDDVSVDATCCPSCGSRILRRFTVMKLRRRFASAGEFILIFPLVMPWLCAMVELWFHPQATLTTAGGMALYFLACLGLERWAGQGDWAWHSATRRKTVCALWEIDDKCGVELLNGQDPGSRPDWDRTRLGKVVARNMTTWVSQRSTPYESAPGWFERVRDFWPVTRSAPFVPDGICILAKGYEVSTEDFLSAAGGVPPHPKHYFWPNPGPEEGFQPDHLPFAVQFGERVELKDKIAIPFRRLWMRSSRSRSHYMEHLPDAVYSDWENRYADWCAWFGTAAEADQERPRDTPEEREAEPCP